MMTTTHIAIACASALIFTWLGIICGISFLATPGIFHITWLSRAQAIEINQTLFSTLSRIEMSCTSLIALALITGAPPVRVIIPCLIPFIILIIQYRLIRPRLYQQAEVILADPSGYHDNHPGPSEARRLYIRLEILKAIFLLIAGMMFLQFAFTCTHLH